MTPVQEAAFDAKVEKHFRSHRELPSGRNFRCWNRDKDVVGERLYRENYDQIDWSTNSLATQRMELHSPLGR